MSFATSFQRLSSHSDSVTCLDTPSPSRSSLPPSLLLSGSDDGTVRLWDIRLPSSSSALSFRPFRCTSPAITGRSSITSVKFGHGLSSSSTCAVYCSAANGAVYKFDLRYSQSSASGCEASAVLVSAPSWAVGGLSPPPDDLNSLCVLASSGKAPAGGAGAAAEVAADLAALALSNPSPRYVYSDAMLALCDDRGIVTTIDVSAPLSPSAGPPLKTYSCPESLGGHSPSAVLTAVDFRPSKAGKGSASAVGLLASGGTDCKIVLWEAGGKQPQQQGRRPVCCALTQEEDEEEVAEEGDQERGGGVVGQAAASKGKKKNKARPIAAAPSSSSSSSAPPPPPSSAPRLTSRAFNPPMVYGLQWSPCTSFGGQLAAALGDGTVAVYGVGVVPSPGGGKSRARKLELRLDARLRGGHTLAATTLDWCPKGWGTGMKEGGSGGSRDDYEEEDGDGNGGGGVARDRPKDVDASDELSRYLVSGGNDGNIVLWDVLDRRVVDGIKHGEGPNAIKCAAGGEGRVYVADTTHSISLYQYR